LLKLRSAILRTAEIGKLSLEWPQAPFQGRRNVCRAGGRKTVEGNVSV